MFYWFNNCVVAANHNPSHLRGLAGHGTRGVVDWVSVDEMSLWALWTGPNVC